MLGLWAVFTDPPKHTRLRGLMNTAFTTRAVERLRPRVEALVAELIDEVRALGQMDLIRDFAWPLPITVIAEMLGVPREDRSALKTWSDELAMFVGGALATSDKYERAARSGAQMSDYFRDLIGERRASPRDDLALGARRCRRAARYDERGGARRDRDPAALRRSRDHDQPHRQRALESPRAIPQSSRRCAPTRR